MRTVATCSSLTVIAAVASRSELRSKSADTSEWKLRAGGRFEPCAHGAYAAGAVLAATPLIRVSGPPLWQAAWFRAFAEL